MPVPVSDADGDPLVSWMDGLPAGASYDSSRHLLLWTPGFDQAGTYANIVIHVSDGTAEARASLTILVAPTDRGPELTPPADRALREGDRLRLYLDGGDPDGDPVTYSADNLPAGASLNPITGLFDWPVGYAQAGTHTITFRVTSGSRSTEATTTFDVLNANAAPEFASLTSWRVAEGQEITFQAFAFDPDNPLFSLPTRLPDGSLAPSQGPPASVTYTVTDLPPGATFDAETARFRWVPGFDAAGSYVVTFTATDDGNGNGTPLSSQVSVPIQVLNLNRRPRIEPVDNVTTRRGQPVDLAIIAIDSDGDPLVLDASSGLPGFGLPPFATFEDRGDGTGTLHLAPGVGDRGDYSITVRARDDGDGGGPAAVLEGAFTFIVSVQAENEPPAFDPITDRAAVVGEPFVLNLVARDKDQEPLTFDLAGLPTGAVLTPGSTYGTATLTWTPGSGDIGTHQATFNVTDAGNGQPGLIASDSRTIALTVRATDAAPVLAPIADQLVDEGQVLSFAIPAVDPEGDALSFSSDGLPDGAVLDPLGGLLTWSPRFGQAGTYDIPVRVDDGSRSIVGNVAVVVADVNREPTLVPLSTQYGRENTTLQFAIVGGDPDGDATTLSVVSGLPQGATFNPNTGAFSWRPGFEQAGTYTIVFGLQDPAGASDTTAVDLVIDNVNRPPVVATSSRNATLGVPFAFPIVATDLDLGTTLTFGASNLPAGASVNPQTGVFSWTPGPAQAGEYAVEVNVSDGLATTRQTIVVRASVSPEVPKVSIELTPSFPVVPGTSVTVHVVADSLADIRPEDITLTIGGQPYIPDASGRVTLVAGSPGRVEIQATATDLDGLTGLASAVLLVRDPNDTAAPAVSLDPRLIRALLESSTPLVGTVEDANLESWTLAIAPSGSETFSTLASGHLPISGTLATLDPFALPDGPYRLRLTARDIGGRRATTEAEIEIRTGSKPGAYRTSDTDLSLTLGGVNVELARAYDSLQADADGPLGPGWRLVHREVDVQLDLPGTGREALGLYSPLREGTRVFLTLPDGRRVGFTFAPQRFEISGLVYYRPAWQADPGVNVTLRSIDALLTRGGSKFYELATGQPYNPASPFFDGADYTLTAPDGTETLIDARRGVIGVRSPADGSLLHVGDSGLVAANGDAARTIYDTEGRLICVETSDGQRIEYDYDAAGNLVAARNVGAGTIDRYAYESQGNRLSLAIRTQGPSLAIDHGTTPSTHPIDGDLQGANDFAGQPWADTLAAGGTARYVFRLQEEEIASTATGRLLLRIEVAATDGSFQPDAPRIPGLTPLSTQSVGGRAVALFSIDREGLYLVEVSGADATTQGAYEIRVDAAGDIDGSARIDGIDSARIDAAIDSLEGDDRYDPRADLDGDGRIDLTDRLILVANYGFETPGRTIITRPPDRPAFGLEAASDTEILGDGRTTQDRVILVGRTSPGATVRLVQLGLTQVADCNGMFAFLDVPIAMGENMFTVVAEDAIGLTSQESRTIVRGGPGVETEAPTITARLSHDTGRDATDRLTSDPTVVGTIADFSQIAVFRAGLDGSAFADVLDTLQGGAFTLDPARLTAIAGGPLANGSHTLRLQAEDEHGNRSAAFTLRFTLDTTAPATPGTPDLLASSDGGASDGDDVTNDATPTLHVPAGPQDRVRLLVDGTLAAVAAADGPAEFTLAALADGVHVITAQAEDAAGNRSLPSSPLTITINTVAPAPPTLGLDPACDTAPAGDGQTDLEQVVLSGEADPFITVTLRRGLDLDTPIRSTRADAQGHFQFDDVPLAPGSNLLRAVATDPAGNSSRVDVTITGTSADSLAPSIQARLARDTGRDATDGLTSDPTVVGVIDDATGVALLSASLDGGASADITARLRGAAITLTPSDFEAIFGGTLADGPHTLRLVATDTLGHVASPFDLGFTLDATRPLPPAMPDLLAASDSGASDFDDITRAVALQVRVAAEAGSLVRLYAGGVELASGVSDGAFLATVGPLADGLVEFTATAEDDAGNLSVFSVPLRVTIDRVAPSAPDFALDASSDTRPYGDDQTNLRVVRLIGQTEPNARVLLVELGVSTVADASGTFAFPQVTLQDGANVFNAVATDAAGNETTFTRTITRAFLAETDLIRPFVQVSVSEPTVNLGGSVAITVMANDNVGVVGTQLRLNGQTLTLGADGRTTYLASMPGVFDLEATALDAAGNQGLARVSFSVFEPGDSTPPIAAFVNPFASPTAMMPMDILGTASDANLIRYTLEYSVKGADTWVEFASGATSIESGALGQFDPTLLENGYYDVRLTAEDASGNITTATKVFQADGQAKIGNFTVSFDDLTIPAPGFPITATRTYDSRNKTQGDFGFGWTYSLSNVKVTPSSVLGDRIFQTANRLGSKGIEYLLSAAESKSVSVTLPDGRVEKFDLFYVRQQFPSYMPPASETTLFYQARPGTTSKLEALTDNVVTISPAETGAVRLLDRTTGGVYDPQRWKLTTAGGTVFIIDRDHGVESITDLNGNEVTITPDGIIHNSGEAMTVTRDALGRITTITDPMGHQITYEYDAYGDLVSQTDQLGNVTRYFYDENHTLLEIHDPLGRRGARNEYDDSGRLVGVVDPDGNRIELEHDLEGRQEVSRDRLGNTTVHVYDEMGNILSTTDALGHTTTATFDAAGNKMTETDPLGNTTRMTYDASNNLLTKADPKGNTTTYSYDAKNRLASLTDPNGNETSFAYDTRGNLLTTTNALDETTTNTYDARGNLLTTTDPLGNTTTFTYDRAGHMTTETDPLGSVTSYTYDANGNPLTTGGRTSADGSVSQVTTSTVYDASNHVVELHDVRGNMTRNVYDAAGLLIGRTLPGGGSVTYEYDALGHNVRNVFADGSTDSSTYDANGNLIRFVDRAGGVTRIEYDRLNRPIRTINPDGTSTATEYDALGRVTAEIDERGHRTTFGYDDFRPFLPIANLGNAGAVLGRPSSVTDASGRTTAFAYDHNGNIIGIMDPSGKVTMSEVDPLNRITQSVQADGSTAGVEYDAAGRVTRQVSPSGASRQLAYDAAGRLIQVTDELGGVTSFTYDELGNKLSQTDANGHTTQWEYNDAGDVVKRTLPLGMSETFTYDARGFLSTHQDFNGAVTTYSYDTLGRLESETLPDGSRIVTTYDAQSRRETVTDARGTTSYEYDAQGNLTLVVNPDGSTIAYGYDDAGNRTSIETAAGTTTYHYDAIDRVDAVTDLDGGQTTYTYDDAGRLAAVTYPNGITTSYAYNNLGQLTLVESVKADQTVLASYAYTYTAAGFKSRVVELSGRTVDYTYDALNRLIQEEITDPVAGNETITYTYDAVGNRLSKTDSQGTTTYTYDANDRLLTAGNTTYTYDDNGNLTGQTESGATTTYTYDTENHLLSVQTSTETTTYTYDADGARVSEKANGVVTTYLVDKSGPFSQVLEERDAAGQLVVAYTQGLDLISQHRDGATAYYQYDGQLSTRMLTNPNQEITDRYDYDAFGNLIHHDGQTLNHYLYTGEQLDVGPNLYYLRARRYDPVTGRFTSIDPDPGMDSAPLTLNKYVYASASPVDFADPSGEFLLALLGLLFNAITLGIGLAAAKLAIDNTAQSTNLITAGGPPNASVYARNVSVSFGGFGSIVAAASLEGLYIEEKQTWAGYVSLGWGLSLGYSILTPLPVFFPFGLGTTLSAGSVFNIHEPGDYEGDYIISNYFYGALVGANFSIFRSPDNKTYGLEAGYGIDLSIASITITKQNYRLAQGIADRLNAAPMGPPPPSRDFFAVLAYLNMHKSDIETAF